MRQNKNRKLRYLIINSTLVEKIKAGGRAVNKFLSILLQL